MLSIFFIIGYFLMFIVGIYTLVFIYRHHENFGTRCTAILVSFGITDAIFVFSTLYILSITIYFSENINILLWKLSLIFGFTGLINTSLIISFLREYKKIPYFPFLYFVTLLGLLIGSFISLNSVHLSVNPTESPPFIIIDVSNIDFVFHPLAGIIIGIFEYSIIIYYFINSQIVVRNARDRKTVNGFIINNLVFLFPILMYYLYLLFPISIYKELYIFSLWFSVLGTCYMIIKKPEVFLELTNLIYYINIYHKSGILLYSYNFKEFEKESDSTIWGNILIGINHILSEFVDPKDQIEMLQTNVSDIIVNYDELGFAIVLITNHKNEILKKLMKNFAKEFKNKYQDDLLELQDLNKLINVSEFKETKEIVENTFQMYL